MAKLLHLRATVDDFVLAFGKIEALEISNIDDSSQELICDERIQMSLDLSFTEIMSYDRLAPKYGKLAIRSTIKPLMLDICRYKLDTLERRPDVTEAYNNAIDFLKMCIDTEYDEGIKPSLEELEEMELLEAFSTERPKFSHGRKVFSDEKLAAYRNQQLLF